MNILSIVMAFFALLGGLDRLLGNRFGLGKEFEKGISILTPCALSMIGMLVLAPVMAEGLTFLLNRLGLDPETFSILPALFFANDMGGAPQAVSLSGGSEVGAFNGYVVGSMMGCTVSFTLPYVLETVKKEQQNDVFLGLLCGIVGIPFGCLAGGLACGIPVLTLLRDLIPLVGMAAVLCPAILLFPQACVKIFRVFGLIIRVMVNVGLILGILVHLTGWNPLPMAESYENAGKVIVNAAAVAAGAFPMIYLLQKLLKKPMDALGRKTGLDAASMSGFVGTLASSLPVLAMMDKMDRRGILLNAAFIVPCSFLFSDHLAYTLAADGSYVFPMLVGKLAGGVCAIGFGLLMLRFGKKKG